MGALTRWSRAAAWARAVALPVGFAALAVLTLAGGCGRQQAHGADAVAKSAVVTVSAAMRAIPPTATPAPGPTESPSPPPRPSPLPSPGIPTPASRQTPEPPTEVPPTATLTGSLTATPELPRVVSEKNVNLRAGPGLAYPVVAALHGGQAARILGRNAAGDWWQVAGVSGTRLWVARAVVQALGPVDKVALVKSIPTPPPVPTATPRPARPAATPGAEFKLVSERLWDAIENGGNFSGTSFTCGLARILHVYVVDAAGNRLDGITVKSATIPHEEDVTGRKGPGMAEFVLGEAKEVYVLRDAAGREVTSDHSRGVSTMVYDIRVELLIQGGYCRDAKDCASFVAACSCCHHYSWDVTFQRVN